MEAQLPTTRGIALQNIVFPHFEFECTLTEDERLIAPEFEFAVSIKDVGERNHQVEIKMESRPDKPADFRALIVARLAFSVSEQDPLPRPEEVQRFLRVNSLVLAWPFIRELVSSATARMGFPALLLPMLNVSKMYANRLVGEQDAADIEGEKIEE